jgi:AGZA family xanthine/uracil permease-like MFS transporter
MSKQAGVFDVKNGDFEGSSVAFLVDSACISASGLFFGTSPCTPFVESASGIGEGGRTGLTAIATSFWFFISIFFAPILSNIPAWATGSVLIIVGAFMMENASKINWDYLGDSIPAFIVLACIPFTCKQQWFPHRDIADLKTTSRMVSLLGSSPSSSCTTSPTSSAKSPLVSCRPAGTT